MTSKDDLISSIDRSPYIEVDGHESSGRGTIEQMGLFFGMSYVALKGIQFAKDGLTIEIKPSTLKYLDKGLSTAENPWWKVAGHSLSPTGTINATLVEVALEGAKRVEEMLGGIPRTLGGFHAGANQVFTDPNSRLFISPDDLKGAESHYDALLKGAGHGLTAEDKLRGLSVAPHQGKPTIFRMGPEGQLGDPLVSDVTIRNRTWFPGEGADEKYRQLNRALDRHSEAMGGNAIAHSNQSKFAVTKAQGPIKLSGILAETAETFGVRAPIESFLSEHITGQTHETLRDARIKAAELTKRALSVLDSPLEIYEELFHGGPDGSRGLLKSARDSKGYGYFKNLFGAGGNYTGGTSDMLVRHAGRIAIGTAVLATGYQAVSMATEFVSGQSADQVVGDVAGAAERLYASSSDITGLTSLNKAQEREAPGSGRIAGVLSFGLSGYLTGQMFSAGKSLGDTPEGVMRWSSVRQATHDAPGPLKGILGKGTRGRQYGLIGAMVGIAASAAFLPGALGSSRSLDEVKSEQSGETEVAVRKGAGWEMSRTDIEGEQIMYYRPSWFARLQDDPSDELQYGDYGDRPVSRFLKGLVDPYWQEKENYYQRPYPITGADTSGFGVLGTLWGATVGGILKPTKYMHTGELSSDGQEGAERGEVSIFGDRISDLPSEELGARGPQRVKSPYSADFMLGELAYKATEAVGLPGYMFSAAKKRLTGQQDFGTEEPVLETSARVGSIADNFWSLNIGGGYGTTESFRRMFPDERFQLEKINPVLNEMPSWLPGAGSFTDFQHGDPYSKVQEGEYRLPGSGYENRFEELKGLSPEDYPDIHKYKILADVAPYSKQLTEVRGRVESASQAGELSERDQNIFAGTEQQLAEKEKRIRFEDSGDGFVGRYWDLIKGIGRANPAEHLIPFSPVHKFAGPVDAISEYETRNLYSKASPAWDSPLSDFILPAIQSPIHAMGFDFVPREAQGIRDLTGYFDKLDYIKNKKLEATARDQGVTKAAFAYSRKAEYTMYGADPFGTVEDIMKVLPGGERPYFKDFLEASSNEEKSQILQITPEYTRKFYLGQWQKQIYSALAMKGGLNSDEQAAVQQIEATRALEGETVGEDTWDDYQSDQFWGGVKQNTFPDYARAKNLSYYFEDSAPLPEPPTDWLGYNPDVSMKGVKLKTVQSLGKDFHDFDLWESDVQMSRRSDYLDTAAENLIGGGKREDNEDLVRSLQQANLSGLDVEITPSGGDKTRVSFDVGTDRSAQLKKEMERMGYRYGT
jgi:hypothetical protein